MEIFVDFCFHSKNCDFQIFSARSYLLKRLFKVIISSMGVKGVDRIVPMGKTMDFSLIWDGYDLLEHMSRRIAVL